MLEEKLPENIEKKTVDNLIYEVRGMQVIFFQKELLILNI